MAPRRTRGDGPTDDGDARAIDEGAAPPDPIVAAVDDPTDDDASREGATDDEAPGTEQPGAAGPPRRLLDLRTVALCTVVALIAALLAGLLVSRLTDDGDDAEEAAVSKLTAAETAPDVILTRFDGTEASLADYRGQALVVNFWGSWCAPCVEEMPDLQAVHESLGEQVTFVGVNIRDEPEAALALAERTGVTYELVRDLDGDLSRELEVTNFPTTILVLPDGTVVDRIQRKVSSERLCEKINQSLLGGSLTECG